MTYIRTYNSKCKPWFLPGTSSIHIAINPKLHTQTWYKNWENKQYSLAYPKATFSALVEAWRSNTDRNINSHLQKYLQRICQTFTSKVRYNSKNWVGRTPLHPLVVTVFHFKICRLIIPPVCFLSNPQQSSPTFPFKLLRTTNPLLHAVSTTFRLTVRSAPLPKSRPQFITTRILAREHYFFTPSA
jgi:hypothetical protein